MPESSTSIVTLRQAEIDFRSDGELCGAILVEPSDGKAVMYAQFLPQHPHVDPPGWGAITDITGVTADEVIAAWGDDRNNEAAERAFARLRDNIGRRFLATTLEGVADEVAVELVPLETEDPEVKIDLDEGVVISGPAELRFTRVQQVILNVDPNDEEQPHLVIISEDATRCVIRVPDSSRGYLPDPPEWSYFVEPLTAVPAVKVAYAWNVIDGRKTNEFLQPVVLQLSALMAGRLVPMTEVNELHLVYLRRALVQERFAQGIEPYLFVGRNPKAIVRGAWSLLQDVYASHLFRYNVERGANSGLPAILRPVEGRWKLEVLDTKEKMRGALFTAIDFCRPGSAKSPVVGHVTPPNVISEHMITFADQNVSAIDTLSRIPTIRGDGTIHDTEGYDAKSRIWYAPELKLEPVPERPTDSDVRRAKATIMEPFNQFPFVEDAGSIAGTVACLVDQIVRPMISGPRPIYAFDAPALKGQGTGKTLIALAIGTIITGREIEVTGWPDDPKELPKLITSKLMQGEPFVIFDNLEGTVRHKDLAACATSTMWSSRLLHTNETPKLPQTATWCMTLNGARFSRDIARRTITVKLDARMPDPHKRSGFSISPLIPWCVKHRAQIIRACLIMARAWVVAGAPEDKRLVAGSFEAWQKVVGGILHHAEINDLPRAVEESRGRDIEATEHDEFIAYWASHYADQCVTPLQLASVAEEHTLYGAVLEKVKAANWKGRHMAEILRKLQGHTFGGWRVTKQDQKINGQFLYALVRIAENPGYGPN